MNRIGKILVGAIAACTLQVHAATVNVEAFDNATVQPGGPRAGSSGKAFFNIEGSNNGNFASYGVARFDLAAQKLGFDTSFGVGGWRIDTISLSLVQSNASFTNDGQVNVAFTDDDSESIQPGTSPLAYPAVGDFADAQSVIGYFFAEIGTGTLESHALYDVLDVNTAGALALAADILSGDLVTLLFLDGDPAVAATYAGFSHSSLAGPTLSIAVSAVPLPAALPLMASAFGLVLLRRR